jgi:hypothetical protein
MRNCHAEDDRPGAGIPIASARGRGANTRNDGRTGIPRLTAQPILANQPRDIVDRLFEENVEIGALGPVDEHRLKILFRRYSFRIKYTINLESHHIEWVLDERFDNDVAFVSG